MRIAFIFKIYSKFLQHQSYVFSLWDGGRLRTETIEAGTLGAAAAAAEAANADADEAEETEQKQRWLHCMAPQFAPSQKYFPIELRSLTHHAGLLSMNIAECTLLFFRPH